MGLFVLVLNGGRNATAGDKAFPRQRQGFSRLPVLVLTIFPAPGALESVSYTHLRAHETPEHLVCRLLLEKKKKIQRLPLNRSLSLMNNEF